MHDVQSAPPHAIQQRWREVFERVASQTELTEELASLTELLKLPLSCCLAVHQVLKEGNWAKSEYPKAYIKKAAMTQARKLQLAIPHRDDTLECGGSPVLFMGGGELDRTTTRERIEKSLNSDDREYGAARPKRLKGKHYVAGQRPDRFSSSLVFHDDEWYEDFEVEESRSTWWPDDCWTDPKVPAWLDAEMRARHEKNQDEYLAWKSRLKKRDWRKLGRKVGLDLWAIKVLVYRSQGISRDVAMSEQPDEVSRKAIQAAWRYMDRMGFQQVREFLKNSNPENVPDGQSEDTRKLEECAPLHLEAAISGNPLQAAWKRTEGASRGDLGKFLIKYRGRAPRLWEGTGRAFGKSAIQMSRMSDSTALGK